MKYLSSLLLIFIFSVAYANPNAVETATQTAQENQTPQIQKSNEAQKITINFLHNLITLEKPLYDLSKKFTKQNPNIDINISAIAKKDLKTKLNSNQISDIQNKDIFLLSSDLITHHDPLNLKILKKESISPRILKNLGTTTYENDTYGIPIFYSNYLVFFANKSLILDIAPSYEVITSQTKTLKNQGAKGIGLNYNDMYWFSSFLLAFDANPLEDGIISLDNENTQQALEVYKELVLKEATLQDCNYDCSQNRFAFSEFAYSLNGDWSYDFLKTELKEFLVAKPLPKTRDKDTNTFRSSIAIMFADKNQNQKKETALINFSNFLQSQDTILNLTTAKTLTPVNPLIQESLLANNNDINKKELINIASNAIDLPPSPYINAMWHGMEHGFRLYMQDLIAKEDTPQIMQKIAEHKLKLESEDLYAKHKKEKDSIIKKRQEELNAVLKAQEEEIKQKEQEIKEIEQELIEQEEEIAKQEDILEETLDTDQELELNRNEDSVQEKPPLEKLPEENKKNADTSQNDNLIN